MGRHNWKYLGAEAAVLAAGLLALRLAWHQGPWLSYFLFGVAAVAGFRYWRAGRRHLHEFQTLSLRHKVLDVKARYFESVIINSPNIIFTTDSEHRIMKFNRGSERAFGITQMDVVGKEVQSLFEDKGAIAALLAEVENAGLAEAPAVRIRPSGADADAWLSISVTRMLNRDRGVIGEVFNCVNITNRMQLERELQDKNDQLLKLSLTDGLTGLYNVRHLQAEASRLLKAHRRYPDRPLALALIDVDHFKVFNDTKGHQAGDQLLVTLSRILRAELREGLDSAYRYGGDEFVLLLPDTTAEGARAICERVQAQFRREPLRPASLSVGIAEYRGPAAARDLQQALKEFIRQADEAMYRGKCEGGNDIRIFGRPAAAAPAVAGPPTPGSGPALRL